jgi:Rhomboid family
MSRADLFVVCKNPECGAEVSPYITECPYCGTRLQKRAPKLDRALKPTRRMPAPSLGRLRPDEIPGIRADSGPFATAAIILATCGVWVASRGGYINQPVNLLARGPLGPAHPWWRVLTAPFAYVAASGTSQVGSGAYQFATLFVIAIFGWLVERRHGSLAVIAVFAVGAVGGVAASTVLDPTRLVGGANGGALALLCAWAIPDLLARRGGHDYGGDLLGAGVIALTLLALPLVRPEASPVAGGVGVLAGYLAGAALARRQGH